MNFVRLCRYVATLGPFGYALAPGTVASILTLPLVHILQAYTSPVSYVLFITALFVCSLYIVRIALQDIGKRHDPSEIVLDEVMGCLITFIAIPFNAKTALMGLVLFRFFDISKCAGIEKCEQLAGAWGVILDDVAAGLLSNIILHIIMRVSW